MIIVTFQQKLLVTTNCYRCCYSASAHTISFYGIMDNYSRLKWTQKKWYFAKSSTFFHASMICEKMSYCRWNHVMLLFQMTSFWTAKGHPFLLNCIHWIPRIQVLIYKIYEAEFVSHSFEIGRHKSAVEEKMFFFLQNFDWILVPKLFHVVNQSNL